ncbi:hypothetical protein UFOVP331_128 [uncultured Caudovirales phage]|uniref:Uncharacterized protein n=1 Tax=uncultured Caudovirales phage TaxID=2100421 RepID=A0A6J5LVM5_9CAUD|nr:hypothetical protein UFOVP331_128 [uncultured Caudovirales phage]
MKNNSIKQILISLRDAPNQTENEIFISTFGYNRNTSKFSNKKYAEMLRRGLKKGYINRTITKDKKPSKFVYFLDLKGWHFLYN